MIVYLLSKVYSEKIFLFTELEDHNCNLFQPVITDHGICHSFNPTPSHNILRKSYYSESFKEAFKDDLILNYTLHKATGSGQKHSLNFILMGNNFQREYFKGLSNFRIGLTSGKRYINPPHHFI